MNLSPINYNMQILAFGHGHSNDGNHYSTKEKAIVTAATALGVGASLAVLAKGEKYSLNPKKMFKNFKNSYIAKTEFKAKQIISIGVGTCLGGLAGGYMVDNNEQNRKAKRREAVMQIGNISVPILTVAGFNKVCSKYGKAAQAIGSIAGIFTGVYIANFMMNKLGNVLFHNKDERGVKVVDFSAHLDDVMAGAQYISDSKWVHNIARFVPVALIFPGVEVGIKRAGENKK